MTERQPVGPQHAPDDAFKAAARLHQSRFRADVLQVGFQDYGNRLLDDDGRALLNYFDGLGVRDALRERYPKYSRTRDADMLRSEHIPFNFFGPLRTRPELAARVLKEAFKMPPERVLETRIEYAPEPREEYLDDATSFDAYIEYEDADGARCGVGVEVKYTEGPYRAGATEAARVADPQSRYWTLSNSSDAFERPPSPHLGSDELRQLWRNHLLGLSMIERGDIREFHSVTLHPAGNRHCKQAVPHYRALLAERARARVIAVTFDAFIAGLEGGRTVSRWREYLTRRYLASVRGA